MTARSLGRTAARLTQAVKPAVVRNRASQFARTLKAEFEAGKLAAAQGPDEADEAEEAERARAVAEAMRRVDWGKVRAATGEKSAEAAQAMKTMAAEVDWAAVQPVAAKLSSALIAAVASGQLGIGGRLGGTVARTILNDRNLGQRVSTLLALEEAPLPPDFRPAITAVIDADGVVHQTTELFKNTVVTGTVTTVSGRTPYVRFGDWVEWGSSAALVAALALGLIGRRRIRPGPQGHAGN
jgi:hypothetical protein